MESALFSTCANAIETFKETIVARVSYFCTLIKVLRIQRDMNIQLIGTCPFNTAWNDAPKGDLNSDGFLSGPGSVVVENSFMYPYGTTEAYPDIENSDFQSLSNTAHMYAECSNAVINFID